MVHVDFWRDKVQLLRLLYLLIHWQAHTAQHSIHSHTSSMTSCSGNSGSTVETVVPVSGFAALKAKFDNGGTTKNHLIVRAASTATHHHPVKMPRRASLAVPHRHSHEDDCTNVSTTSNTGSTCHHSIPTKNKSDAIHTT